MNYLNHIMGNNVRVTVHLRHTALYPGNVIEGFVEIVVTAPTPFRAIRVRACGKELVHVERKIRERIETPPGEPQRYRERTEIRENRQAVYNQLTTLAGSMKTMPINYQALLPPGTFHYPFAFQLPKNIPPSFSKKITDDYGEIIYYVKAYVDVPNGRDAMSRTFFNVIRPMPLHQHAAAAPFNFQHTYDITCCCCCSKGQVSLRMHMNRTIIALDRDVLEVVCDVDNTKGEEPVESLHMELSNMISYKAGEFTESHRLSAGSQTLRSQVIAAGAIGQIFGTVPLNRAALASLSTMNLTSKYLLTATVQIPWADDPVQAINVIVGQTVDESNWSDVISFEQAAMRPLPKHFHTAPEIYYQPPPQPVYTFNPAPVQAVQQYQPATYGFQLPPYGAPNQQWQGNQISVQGQVYQQQSSSNQIVWQQGYNPPL
jgi:hypothetical protein